MTKRALDAQDDERRRIALELHDSTAQQLVAMTMNLEMLEDALPRKSHRVQKLLRDSLRWPSSALREIRTISYLLHPPLLDQLGLTPALRSYIDGFSKRSGIQVTVDDVEGLGRFPRRKSSWRSSASFRRALPIFTVIPAVGRPVSVL